MKTLKITLSSFALLFSSSLFALDPASGLDEDSKTLVNMAAENLHLEFNDTQKLEFFEEHFKTYVQDGWNIASVNDNEFIGNSKVTKEPVKFVNYILSYETRTVFLSLIHYPSKKQILSTTNETIPLTTSEVLKYYNEKIEDDKWVTIYDTSNYSMFQLKGKAQYANYHVNGSNSIVIYSSGSSFSY